MLDRLVIMEPAVGKLPELQVRKLTRKNQTHSALFIGCCEHFSAVRYVSRVQLKPGEYPPRFEGEVTEWTLQRKLGMATDKYVHGKVITASYLLEQISVTLFGAIAIFGDMLSDVYMAYSLYNDKQYEELSGTLCGWSYQSLYACITGIVFAVWFLCSFIYAAKILAMEPRRQHLSESRPRSLLHLLSTWFVLAFNVPLWMLDLANPQQIQKLFCVKDDRNVSHYGLIFVGQKLTDWKFTAKLAKSIQWPNIILEDILLTFLSAYIYSESGITLPAAVSLGFCLFSLVYKLAVHAPFVNAFCCKRCVNADADKKYDITLDDYENQSSSPDSDHQTTQKPSIQPPTPQTYVEPHLQPSDDIERTASMDTHTPRTPWPQVVQATSSSSRCRNLTGSSRSKMSILERQCTGDGIPPGGVAPYSSSKPRSGGKGQSEEEEKGLLNSKDDDIQLQPPLIHDVDDTIASGVPEYEKSEQPLTELISNGSPRSERRKGKRRCKSTQGDYCRPTSFFGWNSSEKAKAQARSKSYEPRAWQQFGSHLTTQQNVDLEEEMTKIQNLILKEEISKIPFWRSSAAAASPVGEVRIDLSRMSKPPPPKGTPPQSPFEDSPSQPCKMAPLQAVRVGDNTIFDAGETLSICSDPASEAICSSSERISVDTDASVLLRYSEYTATMAKGKGEQDQEDPVSGQTSLREELTEDEWDAEDPQVAEEPEKLDPELSEPVSRLPIPKRLLPV